MAISADNQRIVSGSFDGTVKVWDMATGQPKLTLQGDRFLVMRVALSGDQRLASGGREGIVKIWEAGEP